MVENKNDVLFGKSMFGGFNRKAVMEYIDKLQRSAMENEGEDGTVGLSEVMADLRKTQVQLQTLQAELSKEQAENERLRTELTALKNTEGVEDVVALQEEIKDLKARLKVEQTANEIYVHRHATTETDSEEEFFEAVEDDGATA